MFDIGFFELLLIAVVALIVMGPQRLPQAMRSLALWLGRGRQMFNKLRQDLENEVGMDDVRRQLHNEQVLRDLKDNADELKDLTSGDSATSEQAEKTGPDSEPDPHKPSDGTRHE